MAQFTVYQNKNPLSKKSIPLLLDIQSNLLESLQTTVVIPLVKLEANIDKKLVQLTPVLELEGKKYIALTPQLSGISRKELGAAITDANQFRTDIINAMDFLLTGV